MDKRICPLQERQIFLNCSGFSLMFLSYSRERTLRQVLGVLRLCLPQILWVQKRDLRAMMRQSPIPVILEN